MNKGVPVSSRQDRVGQLIDVCAHDDPPSRPCPHGLVLGQPRFDERHALFAAALANHHHGRVAGRVEREPLGQIGDPFVDFAVKPAALELEL